MLRCSSGLPPLYTYGSWSKIKVEVVSFYSIFVTILQPKILNTLQKKLIKPTLSLKVVN